MSDVEANLIYFRNRRRHSINYCLWVLGAPKSEVYANTNRNRLRTECNYTMHSIYQEYSKIELRDWAKHLRDESLKKYHPDRHPENTDFYTQYCQAINEAYVRAMKILNLRKRQR